MHAINETNITSSVVSPRHTVLSAARSLGGLVIILWQSNYAIVFIIVLSRRIIVLFKSSLIIFNVKHISIKMNSNNGSGNTGRTSNIVPPIKNKTANPSIGASIIVNRIKSTQQSNRNLSSFSDSEPNSPRDCHSNQVKKYSRQRIDLKFSLQTIIGIQITWMV